MEDVKVVETIGFNGRFNMDEGENLGDWVMLLIRIGTVGSGIKFVDKVIELHLGHMIL